LNWFQHDADSTQDAKIKKLLIRHGAVGYAVYFHCLELIIGDVCETNITFELEHDSEIIADNLKISGTGDKSGRDIVEDIMRTIVDLGLFTNENGHIFCYKLLKRINMSMTSNKGLREAITSAKELNHDEIMTHHDKVMSHHATYLPTNQPTIPTNKETPDKPAKSPKHKHGEYSHVLLTSDEYIKLCEEWGEGETLRMIKILDEGIEAKGYKYKNHNLALRKWKANEKGFSKPYSKPVRDLSNGYILPDNMDIMPEDMK
jgi:hypothetical protein